MIKIGVLGAAQVAPYGIITPVSLREDCEINVIACRDIGRGKAFASLYNIPNLETSYKALIQRDDVDLVYNALPPHRHADLSIAAVEAGKTVLCEKPFAMNAKEAQRMLDASIRTGIPIIEAFHYQYHPAFSRLLEILRSGEIGEIRGTNAIFVAPVPYREGEVRHTLEIGGGTLMDMGCYPIHWSRMIMGKEPMVKSADAWCERSNVDTTTKAELLFDDDVLSTIECSMDSQKPFQAELSVFGTKGRIHFENPLAPQNGHLLTIEKEGMVRTEKVAGGTTYDLQLAYTIDVMKGEAAIVRNSRDSVANMTIIDEIYRKASLPLR
jgi:predicted dehydrogenase